MSGTRPTTLVRLTVCAGALAIVAGGTGRARATQAPSQQTQAPARFGAAYVDLDARRQKYIADWVGRFNELTGLKTEPGPFYDSKVKLSAKTTFDAVTNALMTTALTEKSGAALGDALSLVERVESVRGEIVGASGDHQFRMYVLLTANALPTLEKTAQFSRGADNTIFHKGYPINYRQQGGSPSIQISIALDHRHADIDVDYRS